MTVLTVSCLLHNPNIFLYLNITWVHLMQSGDILSDDDDHNNNKTTLNIHHIGNHKHISFFRAAGWGWGGWAGEYNRAK